MNLTNSGSNSFVTIPDFVLIATPANNNNNNDNKNNNNAIKKKSEKVRETMTARGADVSVRRRLWTPCREILRNATQCHFEIPHLIPIMYPVILLALFLRKHTLTYNSHFTPFFYQYYYRHYLYYNKFIRWFIEYGPLSLFLPALHVNMHYIETSCVNEWLEEIAEWEENTL